MPSLDYGPGSLQFGDVTTGHTATLILTMANLDPIFAINITSFSSSLADFAVVGGGALPGPINSMTTLQVQITYTAGALGAAAATITFESDADNAPIVISVFGNSVAAGTIAISVNPSAYIFPTTKINANSAAVTFTVANTGTVNCTVQIPVINGPFTGVGLPVGATVLAAGANFTFQVEFSPTVAGYKIQTNGIVVTSTAAASPFNVDLEGMGVIITPAYTVSAGVENAYFAIGPLLRQFDDDDFNTEELSPTLEKLLLLSGPGYEDALLRVEIQYEDRGQALVKISATSESSPTAVEQENPIGTGTPAGKIMHQLFDLKIAGELITLVITSQGPVAIIGIIPRFVPGGEVKK